MPYIWFDLTAGVVLVITGMILFISEKEQKKPLKMGEHQLDVPRSIGVDMLRLGKYISRERNIGRVPIL